MRAVLAVFAILAVASSLSDVDRSFIQQALASAHWEIAAASAEQNSQNANLAIYAQSVIIYQTTVDRQLAALVKQLRIGAAPATSAPSKTATPSSPAEYLREEIRELRREIALYRQESTSGSNPQLLALAAEILPILQSHLNLAQKLLAQIQGT